MKAATQLLDQAAESCNAAAQHAARAPRVIPEDARPTVLLAALEDATAAAARVDEARHELVGHLRDEGASWATIAGALGVSKQAAAQRFGTKPAPATETGPTLLDDLVEQP